MAIQRAIHYGKIVIRCETDTDIDAIRDVTVAAFKTLEISSHTEQFIIAALRAAKSLALSLVAEVNGRVVGHIAFSPVAISDGSRNWYGLGPLSVLPEFQRQGIGKALIEEALSRLKRQDAQGVCLVGHPDYYRKFGFKNAPGLVLAGVPQEFFFALSYLLRGKHRRAASPSMKHSRRMGPTARDRAAVPHGGAPCAVMPSIGLPTYLSSASATTQEPTPMRPVRSEALYLNHHTPEGIMSDHVYKKLEIVGSSKTGVDDAIRNAIETAGKSLRHIEWFEVVDTRGHVVDGKVAHFQVTLKVGFRIEAD